MESNFDRFITKPGTTTSETEMTALGDMLINPLAIARMPPQMRKHLLDNDGNIIQRTNAEIIERRVLFHNRIPGDINERKDYLDYGVRYDCPKCKNRGNFAFIGEDGQAHLRECDCIARREALRNLHISGLSDLLTRYTLDTWQCREPWQRSLLERVQRYAERPEGWFVLTGSPGTGKTHLCTALCGLLLERGYYVRYMLWRDFAQKAKAAVNDADAYSELLRPFLSAKVLYIDDFFKAGRALNRASGKREPMSPTEGDINLAFAVINTRYNNPKLLTVISSEMSLGNMLDTDEAVGSRIAERARNWYQDLRDKDPKNPKFHNWRLM